MNTGFLVIEISIIKTRRSGDRGIFIMGICMQIRWHLNVEKTPISHNRIVIFTFGISLWQYTANLKGIQLIYFFPFSYDRVVKRDSIRSRAPGLRGAPCVVMTMATHGWPCITEHICTWSRCRMIWSGIHTSLWENYFKIIILKYLKA